MQLRNNDDRFGWVSLGFHWLTVLLVVTLCLVGFLMQELPNGPFKIQVFALHKSTGLTVLALTVLRLLWRLAVGVPAPAPGMPRWQQLAASVTHGALYVILLAMPLSGWLYNSAAGFPLRWFGLFALPKLAERDHDIKELAEATHETLFLVLAAIVTAHALAALKHHYLDRDRTLVRMLPLVRDPAAAAPSVVPGATATATASDTGSADRKQD